MINVWKEKDCLAKKKKKKKEEKNHLYNLRNFKYKFQILKRQHYIEFINQQYYRYNIFCMDNKLLEIVPSYASILSFYLEMSIIELSILLVN